MHRYFPKILQISAVLLGLIPLNSCVRQALIPTSADETIRHYQRISVGVSAQGMWSKTDFTVSPGDYILILAYGRVYAPWWRGGLVPNGPLIMKLGEEGEPRVAVAPNNRRFFCPTESGRLAFGIQLPIKERAYRYVSGLYKVDIFVFSSLNEEDILQALDEVAKANPADALLGSQLRQIIGQHTGSNTSAAAQQDQDIKQAVLPNVSKTGGSVEETPAVEDHSRQCRTIFQAGHKAAVRSAAFSPNGKYIISGGEDKTLRLWETYTGREVRVFTGHFDAVTSVAFSPDGKLVLAGSRDRTLRLWEATSGKEIRRFEGHEAAVNSVAYSPDGKLVISGGDDQTARLWEASTGKEIICLMGHEGPVNSVTFSPDGKYALSGSWDGTVRVWDISRGKKISILEAHKLCVNSVAFSPDGEFVLSGSDDNTLTLWNTFKRKAIKTFEGHKYQVTCVAFSPDGKYVLSGSHDHSIRMWEVTTGKEIKLFKGHSESVRSVAFSPDGRHVLSSSNDKSLRLWEVGTGRQIRVFEGHRKSIRSVAYSPDGKSVLTGSSDGSLRLWELSTGRAIRAFIGHKGSVNSTIYSPKGEYVISGGEDKTIRLWEVSRGREIRELKGHRASISSVACSPNGVYVLSGAEDKTIRLWEASTGREIRVLELFHDVPASGFFSPDGRYVISTSNESFRVWEVSNGREVRFTGGMAEELLGSVTSLAISPDGKHILCGSADNHMLLWRFFPETRIRLSKFFLKGHTGPVNAVAFSPDGRYVLSGSKDKSLRLWDISTGQLIKVFNGHGDTVNSVAFSPDGKFAVSGGDDCSARLWSLESGEEIVSLHYSKDGEWMLTTPDGYYSCSPEGSALLYWVYPGGMETFTYEQFESRFRRPDIIMARLAGDLNAGKPTPEVTLPPNVNMADHLAMKETNSKNYPLSFTASASKIVKNIRIFVNGKPTLEVPVNAKEKNISLRVPLFSGANRITAVACDEKGFSSNPKYLDVICKDTGTAKSNLYIFAIGISNYPRLPSRWQLEFAHTDAQALIKSFLDQEGKLFGEVRYNLLSNEKATVDNILKALDALSGISANDVAIVFMAGHGIKAQDGKFYFLTADGSLGEPKKGGVSWTLLGKYLERIKGRVILLLDACHSGSIVTETVVPNDELAQQLFAGGHGGVMIFSASKGRQYSLESPDIAGGFGVFTYTLVQSLGLEARLVDINGDGFIEFMEMVDYVSQKVHKVTKGEQTPWLSRKELFGDLPIAVVN